MANDRKKLAVKSSAIGLGSKLIAALLSFVSRKIFLQYLGTDLLGVNSTLVQVLDTLSLTELGFQTAIIYQLYRPIQEGDHLRVSKIVMFLKRVYRFIGIAIICLGTIASPLLPVIITRVDVDFRLVYCAYFIMLAGTASSYFLSYNKALLQADQRIYIINTIDSILQIVFTGIKIVSLIVFKNFILYAALGVINTVCGNYISYLYYKKKYQWIDPRAKADKQLQRTLVTNTRDVFLGKIGGYVYSSTDNLVISTFVGTGWVGMVGNYTTITAAIKMFIFGLSAPIQPMLGSYAIAQSKDSTETTMNNYGFIKFAMAALLLIPTICLSDMFVSLFYGSDFVLQPAILFLLTADLFIVCMQGSVGEMIDALGYFKEERNLYFVYALMNLSLSIIGAIFWGIVPVFVATVLSQLVGWVWRSVIAYKQYFHSKPKFLKYWKKQLIYILAFYGITFVMLALKKMINLPYSYFSFIVYGIIIEVMTCMLFIVLFRKTSEYKYLLTLLSKIKPSRKM